MTKYKLDRINSRRIKTLSDIEVILDTHAHEGWEVVSVCRSGFINGQSYYLITMRQDIVQDNIIPEQGGNDDHGE